MGMTLDEHIKKAEEDAAQAEDDSDWGFGNYFIDRTEAVEYAENCRQLVEWLKELKGYRSIKDQIAFAKRNIQSENSDYLTGYLSALSAVEGMIAEAEDDKN